MSFPPGHRFGRYEVVTRLGSGGMGEVYVARDRDLGRRVALKVLPALHLEDEQARWRFRQEARAIVALNHPNIITVFDVGSGESGPPFIVSELVEGVTVRDRLRVAGFRTSEALEIAVQAASGLAAAHAAGVVHRDIKPENLMLRPDGYVKVLDFGLALLPGLTASPDEPHTRPHTVVGTVRYMSPEQVRAESLDTRTDIWSLGVVLFEMLTGRRPFDGETSADAMAAVLSHPTPRLARHLDGPSRTLQRLIDRTLQKDRGRRHDNAAELARELRALAREALPGFESELRTEEAILTPGSKPSSSDSRDVVEDSPPAVVPSPLPRPTTPIVGREGSLEGVARLLRQQDTHLVTLTGPGGVGKTRLALAVAERMAPEFPGGVFLAPLAEARDPAEVPTAIAHAVGVREEPQVPALDSVGDALSDRSALLILDNFEHVAAAAPSLAGLFTRAPRAKLLATSRARLNLSGEHEFAVLPLPVPKSDTSLPLPRLSEYGSVALFVDRARAIDPSFTLTTSNASAVAEICARLDGLPLAIELAAARVKLLSPQAIASRLTRRLPLLTAGPRDLPARQRTMRDAIVWGHQLLTVTERQLFCELSVFRGGFTAEAAEAVASPASESTLLDVLGALVDHSLVRRVDDGESDEPRFGMLETIREFADEERRASPGVSEVERRHAELYLRLAEEAAPSILHDGPWLERLSRDHDNLRAALEWSIAANDVETALRLCAALWSFWYVRGNYSEGRRWIERALALESEAASAARAETLVGAGVLAFLQCDYGEASAKLEAGLAQARDTRLPRTAARALQYLGSIARERGRYAEARERHDESGRLWEEVGDDTGVVRSSNYSAFACWLEGDLAPASDLAHEALERFRVFRDQEGTAWALLNLAAIAHYGGDLMSARRRGREALEIAHGIGFQEGIAWSLNLLGVTMAAAGRTERAGRLLRASLRRHRELGDRWRMASVLEAIAGLVAASDAPRAARILGGAERLRETIAAPAPPVERLALEATERALDEAIGDARLQRLRAAGRRLSISELMALAFGG
jgi:predicted ATPase/serine/threonine protein kinase